jgi:hypothetical protein
MNLCGCDIIKSGRWKPEFQRDFSFAPKMESAVHIHLIMQCHIFEDYNTESASRFNIIFPVHSSRQVTDGAKHDPITLNRCD